MAPGFNLNKPGKINAVGIPVFQLCERSHIQVDFLLQHQTPDLLDIVTLRIAILLEKLLNIVCKYFDDSQIYRL